MTNVHREPAWSGPLTRPLVTRIAPARRPAAIRTIKVVHTVIFFSIFAIIVLVVADGVRARPRRRTVLAVAVALAETGIYGSNNQVCPLSPLAEDLGAASGSVTDIYLPGWLSRRIPALSGSLLMIGLVLNLRAWAAGRAGGHRTPTPA